jgi:hypothetical protein
MPYGKNTIRTGAEKNVWTLEEGNTRRLEKNAYQIVIRVAQSGRMIWAGM